MREYTEEVGKNEVSTPEAERYTLIRFFMNLLYEMGYEVEVQYRDNYEAETRTIRARWEEKE